MTTKQVDLSKIMMDTTINLDDLDAIIKTKNQKQWTQEFNKIPFNGSKMQESEVILKTKKGKIDAKFSFFQIGFFCHKKHLRVKFFKININY